MGTYTNYCHEAALFMVNNIRWTNPAMGSFKQPPCENECHVLVMHCMNSIPFLCLEPSTDNTPSFTELSLTFSVLRKTEFLSLSLSSTVMILDSTN